MEGNLSDMDYAYGGPPSFPIWKPHYFPRGEAPPPYEEAVAISQAEQLSMVTAAAEQVQHYQIQPQPPHVSSTTNLINININSGGNITATAINHQQPESTFSNTQQTSQVVSCHTQDYQQNTPSRLQIASNAICLQTATPLNAIVHQASQPQQYIPISVATVSTIPSNVVECNYKNCYLNNTNIQKRLPQQQQPPKMQVQTQTQAREPKPLVEETQSIIRKSQDDCMGNKTPINRRNHRSIPRHLSITTETNTAETQTTNLALNLKPTCQCPTQHIPMYMGGNNRIHNSSNMMHQSSTPKLPKSVKSTSTTTAGLRNSNPINTKIVTISKQIGDIEEKGL